MTATHHEPAHRGARPVVDLADELSRVRAAYATAVEAQSVLQIGLAEANRALASADIEIARLRDELTRALAAVVAAESAPPAIAADGPRTPAEPPIVPVAHAAPLVVAPPAPTVPVATVAAYVPANDGGTARRVAEPEPVAPAPLAAEPSPHESSVQGSSVQELSGLPADDLFRSSAHEFAALQQISEEEQARAAQAAHEAEENAKRSRVDVLPQAVAERKSSLLRRRR